MSAQPGAETSGPTTPLDPLAVPLTGTQLIEASAGTGKTYTIATLFVRLVVEKKLKVDQILVVTFTNAATAELRDRVRKRLRDALTAFEDGPASTDPLLRAMAERSRHREGDRKRLASALGAIDEAAIHTIHGFSQRVLSEHAFEGGIRPELDLLADVRPLVAEVVDDFWADRVETAPRAAVEYLRSRRTGAAELTALGMLALRTPDAPVIIEGGIPALEAPLRDYFTSRQGVVAAWADARPDVRRALVSTLALNGNVYKQNDREALVEGMDSFVAVDQGSILGYADEVSKFSQARLNQATKKNCTTPSHPFFSLCDELVRSRAALDDELERWAQRLEHDLVGYVRREAPARTAALSSLSFDDLLLGLRKALRGPRAKALIAALRRRFPAALIDEFHDTDPVQYEIFRRVYSGKRTTLFLIGDPKQAIYAFRGADVFAYLAAVGDADGRYTLGTNHRSDPTLVRAVNTVFSRAHNPFVIEDIRFESVLPRPGASDELKLGGKDWSGLELVFVPRVVDPEKKKPSSPPFDDVPRIAANEIARALAARPTLQHGSVYRELMPGDFAVLTRTNKECHDIQRALRAVGVPSVLHGDSSVLETDEAKEFKLVLAALADPASGTNVRSALSTSLFGLDANLLFALGEDEDSWEKWTSDFARWHTLWQERGLLQAIRTLFGECGIAGRVLARVGGERTLTNFFHLTELCHRAAVELHLGVAGLVAWFDEVRLNDEHRDGVAAERAQVRLEGDEHAVQLTTMHRSKGLEYPFVVLPHLWKGSLPFKSEYKRLRFHDPSDAHRLTLDLREEEKKPLAVAQAEHEALAEGVRLTYVALTRARHRCIVIWGPYWHYDKSALHRLLHGNDAAWGGSAGNAPDNVLVAQLEELSRASEGAVSVRVWNDAPPPIYRPEQDQTLSLGARERARYLAGNYRTSSFSALTATDHVESPLDDGRDVDQETTSTVDEAPHGPEAAVALDAFPRGPRAGDVLHAILEDADFTESDSAALERLTRQHLGRQGFDAETWTPVVSSALTDVLATPLLADDPSLTLASVSRSRRVSEMEFTFPAGGAKSTSWVTPERLAKALAGREGKGLPKHYAASVAQLGFAPLAGFLRGFIDLVFEHAGRYYVVDYKSNHLGSAPSAYTTRFMTAAMAQHHYFLQYHMYLVALHRHLSTRLPDYSYERHMGGVLYLFLRGMTKDRAHETGVFFDRPSREVIEELSRTLGHGTAGSKRVG